MNYTSKEVEKLLTRLDDHEIDDDIAIPLEGMFREYILILKSIEESKSVQPHRLDVALREPNSIKSWQVASSPTHPPADFGESKDAARYRWLKSQKSKDELLAYIVFTRDVDKAIDADIATKEAMSAESREGKS